MKARWRATRPRLLSAPVYLLARLLGMTVRIRTEGYEEARALPRGRIYAGWHGRTFLATLLFRGQGVWAIISHSRDGEMQNGIFTRFGFRTIRGSSGRGGARAAIESIKALRRGEEMAITPDGPRGPSGVVQDGILLMAQKSGAAIFPVGVSCSRRWLAPTWDRYMVPKPFSKAIMIFGKPYFVPEEASPDEVESIRLAFEAEMHRLEREAETRMGHPTG